MLNANRRFMTAVHGRFKRHFDHGWARISRMLARGFALSLSVPIGDIRGHFFFTSPGFDQICENGAGWSIRV
jgi:hypothetical protein